MPYQARVFRIMIASPSDVTDERDLVVQCIEDWNALHSADRKVVLLPLRWETHSRPEFGKRPQEIINTTVVDHCDLLIGIFWTRIGTEAGAGKTGTIEEIERVAKLGRPVMLYFSKAKVDPEGLDLGQLAKLGEFKKQTYPTALVEHYSGAVDFRDKISRHIEMKVRELMSEAAAGGDGLEIASPTDLSMELVDPEAGEGAGTEITVSVKSFDVSNFGEIPDYIDPEKEAVPENAVLTFGLSRPNANFYRQYVIRALQQKAFRPVAFILKNTGVIGVRDIYVDLQFMSERDVYFITPELMVEEASRVKGILATFGDLDTDRTLEAAKSWATSVELPGIQPKRSVRTKIIGYLGAAESATVCIKATIYGDCFPEPRTKELKIVFDVKRLGFSALDLVADLQEQLRPEHPKTKDASEV